MHQSHQQHTRNTNMKITPCLLAVAAIFVIAVTGFAPKQKHSYRISLEDVTATTVSEEYFDTKLSVFTIDAIDEQQIGLEITLVFIKDAPEGIEIEIIGKKESTKGNYVDNFKDGPTDYCKYLVDNDAIMASVLKASNFTDCPPKKGVYNIHRLVLDETKFPNGVPVGSKLKVRVNIYYKNKILLSLLVDIYIIAP